jgi:predicted metal-dependent phosphoesterase TrpH
MRIDLHVHSSVSDGTEDPATLMETARRGGLDVVALTDHDTTDGWAVAERARPRGLVVIPGMELSCRWFPADDRPISVHLLAYLFDPTHPGLAAERERLRTERLSRAERIVRALVNGGYPLEWEKIADGCAGGVVGRPHIARALVDAGGAESVDHAFATLLHPRSPYYVAKADTDAREGIALVRAAGGVPVLAHGLATKRRHGRRRDARPRGRPPRPLTVRTGPSARAGRRPGPDRDRIQRLPRHQQADRHRRLHHRPRPAGAPARRGHRQ